MYSTVTGPNLKSKPTEEHLKAAHIILRYLKNSPDQGLFYPAQQSRPDWLTLVSWKTKKERGHLTFFSRSWVSIYGSKPQSCWEIVWLTRPLEGLQVIIFIKLPITHYYDNNNKAALRISRNPFFSRKNKACRTRLSHRSPIRHIRPHQPFVPSQRWPVDENQTIQSDMT